METIYEETDALLLELRSNNEELKVPSIRSLCELLGKESYDDRIIIEHLIPFLSDENPKIGELVAKGLLVFSKNYGHIRIKNYLEILENMHRYDENVQSYILSIIIECDHNYFIPTIHFQREINDAINHIISSGRKVHTLKILAIVGTDDFQIETDNLGFYTESIKNILNSNDPDGREIAIRALNNLYGDILNDEPQ